MHPTYPLTEEEKRRRKAGGSLRDGEAVHFDVLLQDGTPSNGPTFLTDQKQMRDAQQAHLDAARQSRNAALFVASRQKSAAKRAAVRDDYIDRLTDGATRVPRAPTNTADAQAMRDEARRRYLADLQTRYRTSGSR